MLRHKGTIPAQQRTVLLVSQPLRKLRDELPVLVLSFKADERRVQSVGAYAELSAELGAVELLPVAGIIHIIEINARHAVAAVTTVGVRLHQGKQPVSEVHICSLVDDVFQLVAQVPSTGEHCAVRWRGYDFRLGFLLVKEPCEYLRSTVFHAVRS